MHSEHDQEQLQTGTTRDTARADAHRWLARFAPLLEDPQRLDADACRRRLGRVDALREEGGAIVAALEVHGGHQEEELLQTLRQAWSQLPGMRTDLQRRLGALAPGDPAGMVDLDALRTRMAEIAARREVEQLVPTTVADGTLEETTSPANLGAAIFAGVFGLGILSFVTLHAVLMIGGLSRVIGWFSLLLLGFYAIFFGAAGAMLYGAFRMACRETIRLNGRQLALRRSLLGFSQEKTYPLGADSEAYITRANMQQKGMHSTEVAILDERGREIRFGTGRSDGEQRRLVRRINDYLKTL